MNSEKLSNFNSVFFINWKASDYSNVPFIHARKFSWIHNYIILCPLSLPSQHLNLVPYKTSLFYMHFLWDNAAVDAHTQALLALFKRDVFLLFCYFPRVFDRSFWLIPLVSEINAKFFFAITFCIAQKIIYSKTYRQMHTRRIVPMCNAHRGKNICNRVFIQCICRIWIKHFYKNKYNTQSKFILQLIIINSLYIFPLRKLLYRQYILHSQTQIIIIIIISNISVTYTYIKLLFLCFVL